MLRISAVVVREEEEEENKAPLEEEEEVLRLKAEGARYGSGADNSVGGGRAFTAPAADASISIAEGTPTRGGDINAATDTVIADLNGGDSVPGESVNAACVPRGERPGREGGVISEGAVKRGGVENGSGALTVCRCDEGDILVASAERKYGELEDEAAEEDAEVDERGELV